MKVGLLLPLSGPQAALGQDLLNAAQMALFDHKQAQIELLPRDVGSDTASAAAAFDAVVQQGATLIIGPVFAPQVAAIKPSVQRRQLPVLALSNDATVAGDGVYALGVSPSAQTDRVIGFACANGSKTFAALLPVGDYGNRISTALERRVRACPGGRLALRRYDAGSDQLAQQLQATAQARLQIDALVLAETPAALQNVPYPQSLDGTHIRLLGTGLWTDTDTIKRAPFLAGAWQALPLSDSQVLFRTNYRTTYATPPGRLAGLAYDAVALAAALQQRGLRPDRANLTNPAGFAGVDGVFRLHADGLAERGLAVVELSPAGMTMRDPAPQGFLQPAVN